MHEQLCVDMHHCLGYTMVQVPLATQISRVAAQRACDKEFSSAISKDKRDGGEVTMKFLLFAGVLTRCAAASEDGVAPRSRCWLRCSQ